MITSRRATQRTIDSRLGQAGDRIDTIVARARDARGTINGGTYRRVDALRANEARLRAGVRTLREADDSTWDEHSAELEHDLDELDTQIAISTARLNADLAVGDDAFAGAVQAELDCWSARSHTAAATHHAQLDQHLAVVRFKLDEFRNAPPMASPGLRTRVKQAVEDLDRAAEEAAPRPQHTLEMSAQ